MTNLPKILILKQKYDVVGPWSSFVYNETNDYDILNFFHSKTNSYETFLLFEADHIVVDVHLPLNTKSRYRITK